MTNRELLDRYYDGDEAAGRELAGRGFDLAWFKYVRRLRAEGRVPSPKRYRQERSK